MTVELRDLLASGTIQNLRDRIERHASRDLMQEAAAVISYLRAERLLAGLKEHGDEAKNPMVGVYTSMLESMTDEAPDTPTWAALLEYLNE